tara:strand:- start:736 stop:1119 length:384 start_codon:yes stop_codon:yes gene_type:complete
MGLANSIHYLAQGFVELSSETVMGVRASDVVPISEARARLTELADDVVTHGAEKLLTKNGSSFVALVDARKLDYYHALEAEFANVVLLGDALQGLRDLAAGQQMSDAELDELLGVAAPTNKKSPRRA